MSGRYEWTDDNDGRFLRCPWGMIGAGGIDLIFLKRVVRELNEVETRAEKAEQTLAEANAPWHWLVRFEDDHVCHSCLVEVTKDLEDKVKEAGWQGDPGPRTSLKSGDSDVPCGWCGSVENCRAFSTVMGVNQAERKVTLNAEWLCGKCIKTYYETAEGKR